MPRVLVVDDETGVRESLRMLLQRECEVATAASVDEALAAIRSAPPDLILLDLVMPGRSGLDLLAELRERGGGPPVVVVTATHGAGPAVEAMKLGAADYVTKPFEVEALRQRVRSLLEHRALVERTQIPARPDECSRLGELLGRSPAMRAVFRTLERVAQSNVNVLLRGESGTGKELAARALHELGPRAAGPFVSIHCAAIPDTLLESELFGHERGAFTDAVERRIGRFEAAQGGTIFLDEIGELSPAVQAKLLRALQERSIERIGSSRPIPVDARFVVATHRDLDAEVAAGRFRADLYWRIHVVPIVLPPLRERRQDIALLAEAFLRRARQETGAGPTRLSPEALAALEAHDWPGNVRELRNAIERAVALCEGHAIDATDLGIPRPPSGR
jgi:two-component system response regulator HydG